MHVRHVFAPIFLAAALAGALIADPIASYVATSASLTYTLHPGGDNDVVESFSFAGPDLNLSEVGQRQTGSFSTLFFLTCRSSFHRT